MSSPDGDRRSAEHYSDSRAKLLNEAYKVLVVILGGAVIALLAFLQANWENQALSAIIVSGLWWFVAGLACATWIPLLRYYGSFYLEKKEGAVREIEAAKKKGEESRDAAQRKQRYESLRKWCRRGFLTCFPLAMACFVVGAGWILWFAGAELQK